MPRNVPTRARRLMADLGRRPVDRLHGDDDAEHGRHDAETGHGVGRFVQHGDGGVMFAFDDLDFVIECRGHVGGLGVAVEDHVKRPC